MTNTFLTAVSIAGTITTMSVTNNMGPLVTLGDGSKGQPQQVISGTVGIGYLSFKVEDQMIVLPQPIQFQVGPVITNYFLGTIPKTESLPPVPVELKSLPKK